MCFIATFIVISGFNWFWHGIYMASDYRDTGVMWRPMHEMKMSLFALAYALQALAYTYLILASMRTSRWIDALAAGFKIGLFCVAGAIISWNTMPFATHNVAVKWGVGGMIEALVVAIVIKLVNSCACKMCCKQKDAVTVIQDKA